MPIYLKPLISRYSFIQSNTPFFWLLLCNCFQTFSEYFLIYYVLISFTKSTYPKSKRFILNMGPVNVLLHFFHICFNRIKISEWVAWKEIKCYKVYICWWKKIIVWGQKSLCVHTSRLIRNMHFMFKTNLKFIKWNFPLLATELTA